MKKKFARQNKSEEIGAVTNPMPIVLRGIGFLLPRTYSLDTLGQCLLTYGRLIHCWLDPLSLTG